MEPAQLGAAFAAFMISLTGGYVVLGILWLCRVYKRWPQAAYRVAAGVAVSAIFIPSQLGWLSVAAHLLAGAFFTWRSFRVGRKPVPASE